MISSLILVSFQVFKMTSLNSFTDDTDTNVHRSTRATKGSGGQIAQLQHIKCIQSERISSKTSCAAQLNMAMANEPLNPMTSGKPKPQIKKSIVSVRDADDYSDIGLVEIFSSLCVQLLTIKPG